jgi:hypothetical protein
MAHSTSNTRRDLEEAIVEKALSDDTFRASLLANPRQAFETVLAEQVPGAKLPKNLQVRAFEEPEDTFYVVIPHLAPATELSDQDLEKVAGGMDGDEEKGDQISVGYTKSIGY